MAVDASLANVECAVQREFAQDVPLNRIGLGKGPFPFAVRGYSGSGMLEADRVVDLLRTERDHAYSKRRQNGGSRLVLDDFALVAMVGLAVLLDRKFQLGQNRSQ